MPVTVAEYLGVRTDRATHTVQPVLNLATKPSIPCPFRVGNCLKTSKGQQPVCSIRDTNDELWIVCEHRLCATQPKAAALNDHQRIILRMISNAIYDTNIPDADILVKREVPIPITQSSDYKADYVMWRNNSTLISPFGGDKAAIVEMQGGGETAGTEKLTAVVKNWAQSPIPTNIQLTQPANAAPLVTNAWRRQQEQFLVKGNVAMLSGTKMVFCVGSLIYKYLIQRLTTINLVNLKGSNWTLALISFVEDKYAVPPQCAPYSIQFRIDYTNTLYTNYSSFVQALTNQGMPQPDVFKGRFDTLAGGTVLIP